MASTHITPALAHFLAATDTRYFIRMGRDPHQETSPSAAGRSNTRAPTDRLAPPATSFPSAKEFYTPYKHPPFRMPSPRKVLQEFPYMAPHEFDAYCQNYQDLKDTAKSYRVAPEYALKFFRIQAKLENLYNSQPPPAYSPKP